MGAWNSENSIMRVTYVSFTNHTMQPVTTIKQMRWSQTQTERAYNVLVMTNYIMNLINLYTHALYVSQINGI